MTKIDLSEFFITKAQAVNFSACLSGISDRVYETGFDLEKALQDTYGIQKKDKFISLLRDNEVPLGSNTALKTFMSDVIKTITSMPEAMITVAVDPNERILKAMCDWFLLNLKQQVLIDIRMDTDLIAGATINYKGKYHNYSVKAVFDNIPEADFALEGK